MKRKIIISGSAASGKSRIVNGFLQLATNGYIQTTGIKFQEMLAESDCGVSFKNLPLVILEECSINDIKAIDWGLFLLSKVDNGKHYTELPIVFVTNEFVTNEILGREYFYIIHCGKHKLMALSTDVEK